MRTFGIDPGTTSIGYAIVDGEREPLLRASGLINIAGRGEGRLLELHQELLSLLKHWKPERVSVEKLYFAKNTKTALAVSEARGVILLTTTLAGCRLYEYTPLEVKKAVTGDGGADKLQLKKMVQLTLPDSAKMKARDDVFDAIGLALTCIFKEKSFPFKKLSA